MIQLLFVIDNINAILALRPYAEYRGIRFIFATSLADALNIIHKQPIDALILDRWSAQAEVQSLQALKNPPVFLIKDEREASTLPAGLRGFLSQPIDVSVLEALLRDLSGESKRLTLSQQELQCGELIGDSEAMHKVYHLIRKVAPTHASAFIFGATGSGKELVAKAIHLLSPRAHQAYLAINCGAVNDELLSSALFGHEKGSFTGAVQSCKGYFEQASGGTLFLDEVTETSQHLQISLLRVLETQQVMPVGAKRLVRVDVRVLASTNRDPRQAIKQRLLREDLYHRLNVFPIKLPALDEHREDIPALVTSFLRQYNEQYQWQKGISPEAMAVLAKLSYSGNVRQLKHLVYRACILADDIIEPEHLE